MVRFVKSFDIVYARNLAAGRRITDGASHRARSRMPRNRDSRTSVQCAAVQLGEYRDACFFSRWIDFVLWKAVLRPGRNREDRRGIICTGRETNNLVVRKASFDG